MTTRTKKADQETANILEREKKALELRRQGYSYRAIGEQTGVSHVQSMHDVAQALTYIRDDVAKDAANLRDLEVARLDHMLLKLNDRLEIGSFDAMEMALKIMTRRAKLLGLDAPERTDMTSGGEPLAVVLKWHNEPTRNYPPEPSPETGADSP